MDGRVMYSDRDSIREDIRKRLVKIKGIGPEKAAKGSDAVMEYLDSLVSSQQESPCKYVVDRPDGVPEEFNYVMFKPRSGLGSIEHFWVTASKPEEYPRDPRKIPTKRGKLEGLFSHAVNHVDLEAQLVEILGVDPEAFYARFSDV